jgi:hypothetical protein
MQQHGHSMCGDDIMHLWRADISLSSDKAAYFSLLSFLKCNPQQVLRAIISLPSRMASPHQVLVHLSNN